VVGWNVWIGKFWREGDEWCRKK
jgi:hypothetical protein